MGSNFSSLAVTWYDETDAYVTNSAVTDDVISIPLFTDTGSGEVNECEIVISAKAGQYINTGNIIDKFDRLRIQCTDLNSNSYSRYFEIIDLIPSQNKTEGSILTIKCLGIEYHTQVINYARQVFFANPFYMGQNIGTVYEANNGSRQPTIARHTTTYSMINKYGNGLPKYLVNNYEFGLSEDNCYNRWMDIIDSLGGAVAEGGDGEFYDIGFDTPSVNAIDLAIFKSGARSIDGTSAANDSSLTTIANTTSINLSEQEGGISNPTGTNIWAWGSPVHGSLPVDFSEYRGYELEFFYRPEWESGLDYKTGAKVKFNGKHYESTSNHTSSTSNEPTDVGAPWTQIDMGDEFGDTVQYSPWTDDKAILWVNGGVDPDGISSTPIWATTTAYSIGNLVTNGGAPYVCIVKHTSGTFSTDLTAKKWERVDNEKVGNDGAGFFDSNIVINDYVTYRTWVNEVIGDTDYSGTTDQTAHINYQHDNFTWPVGHRLLNISNTSLSGNDTNGIDMKDSIVERRITKNTLYDNSTQWEVFIKPDTSVDKFQVADIKDGKIWEWQNPTLADLTAWANATVYAIGNEVSRSSVAYQCIQAHTSTTGTDAPGTGATWTSYWISLPKWRDVTSTSWYGITLRNDDCLHRFHSCYNINGVDPRPSETDSTKFPEVTKAGGIFTSNIRSAVEVVYRFGAITGLPAAIGDNKKGAWINFSFPFPLSKYNSISEGVGDLYGGGTNESEVTMPSLLDTQNMSHAHDGKLGFNNTSSEDLGPINAVSFYTRLGIYDGTNELPQNGIATIRVTMFDRRDNVVTQDFDINFTDGMTWQEIILPITGFSVYRGRSPKTWIERVGSALNFERPLKELDIQDIFEFRHIKYITIQVQNFYDNEGRYDPTLDLEFVNTGLSLLNGGVIRMAIDGFHFKKPLLVTSGADTIRNIEPIFLQRPYIISYVQLQNLVNSQLEIDQFRHKEFNFQTSGKSIFDVRFGDSIFLQNSDLISDTDDSSNGSAKKIKLVAKRIEYHLTKPTSGPGGITRTIKGVKRFS